MKGILVRAASATSLALLLTGCVGISIGGCGQAPPPAPVVVTPAPLGSTDSATIAEIDAAARLSFDHQRLQALRAIAQRPDFTPPAQVHLVNTTYRALSFDNHRVELLRAIIAHPKFNDATRQTIVVQLNKLSFDQNREEILKAINARMGQK